MSNIAIKIENLSKQYRLGVIGTGTLSHDLNRWWRMNILGKEDPFLKIGETNQRDTKGTSDYVWALRDINLEVKKGEVLGIIGKNGAGKSTLLKILSRVTKPTTGKITYKGRIASLLEVGTGFHPEMTGRENIYMNGTIMGMTRSEISRKLDEIVDFAGIERYIDTPVKRYSSGMTVRLGFAIAAHLEPEILVVDEVLAVGDAEFQKKAIGKMQDVSKGEGRTVLFVSHNMNAVRMLCSRGVILTDGFLVFDGNILDTTMRYEKINENSFLWEGFNGDNTLKVLKTRVYTESSFDKFVTESTLKVSITLEAFMDFNDLVIGITIISSSGAPIASSLYNDFNDFKELSKGKYEIIFSIPPFTLAHGKYSIDFNVSIPYVRKINSDECILSFNMYAETSIGNKYYVENNKTLNSIIRTNWFEKVNKLL
ncbi:MAG: ABC transporter ATP-binding protein [Bacteroidales bacterium]|nr:ABC transporter ATP-binding protein [Bacteroidales bacterium]